MRLSEQHRQAILRVVGETCGPRARGRLFGSRLDDALRGGDVDLLVELPASSGGIGAVKCSHVELLD